LVVRNNNVKTYNAFVLVEWQSMQDTSWWEEENDAPWWYNERASLSLFAGAVWKCKGWVFEEFITKKHMTTRRGKRKNRHGRGDRRTSTQRSSDCHLAQWESGSYPC